jgi:hypothetical protein
MLQYGTLFKKLQKYKNLLKLFVEILFGLVVLTGFYLKVTGCPNMTDSASSVPTLHPRTPRPLTMVVWASVPTSESGNKNGFPFKL